MCALNSEYGIEASSKIYPASLAVQQPSGDLHNLCIRGEVFDRASA